VGVRERERTVCAERKRGTMARKKVSFRTGTKARAARGKVAEQLKRRGLRKGNAFALATYIAKRAGAAGRKRLARRGLRKRR